MNFLRSVLAISALGLIILPGCGVKQKIKDIRKDEIKRFEIDVNSYLNGLEVKYKDEFEVLSSQKSELEAQEEIKKVVEKYSVIDEKKVEKPYSKYKDKLRKDIKRLTKLKYNIFLEDKKLISDIEDNLKKIKSIESNLLLIPELTFENRY